jgi:hypothetical protein
MVCTTMASLYQHGLHNYGVSHHRSVHKHSVSQAGPEGDGASRLLLQRARRVARRGEALQAALVERALQDLDLRGTRRVRLVRYEGRGVST